MLPLRLIPELESLDKGCSISTEPILASHYPLIAARPNNVYFQAWNDLNSERTALLKPLRLESRDVSSKAQCINSSLLRKLWDSIYIVICIYRPCGYNFIGDLHIVLQLSIVAATRVEEAQEVSKSNMLESRARPLPRSRNRSDKLTSACG